MVIKLYYSLSRYRALKSEVQWSYLWYIVSCLTSIDKYFMHIQEDKKCDNI